VLAQIREIILDYREATGPCKARMLAQKLWAGEDYVLQIDSHMRFCPGWDIQLVEWLTDCERRATYSKAVLSTYPPPFKVGHVELCPDCLQWMMLGLIFRSFGTRA
jgi:[Skp1-protein]-hydroxyproline N-acetylglucosaminyltransferase